ncbi:MAG: hypothetical protein IPM29_01685 [Planctomycetes bacterium]|nr:hypothetical protein [Planctomycetota bacterium]
MLRPAGPILGALLCAMVGGSPAQDGPRPTLGVNLPAVVDWSTAIPFVDAVRTARAWIPQRTGDGSWNTGAAIDVDAHGFPRLRDGQVAATLMFRDVDGRYPAGDYLCTWRGDADVDFGLDAAIVSRGARSSGERHCVARVASPTDQGILLRVLRSAPGDPIRDLHLWLPGFHRANDPFHPGFVELLQGFRVLRFMDWMRTNGSPVEHADDAPRPDDATQATERGVAVELAVGLCVRTGAEPWFCMPHRADDAFVRRFAERVHELLPAERRVWVEYSNEIWNGGFRQGAWVEERGVAHGLADDRYLARLREQARRTIEMLAVWRDVFGDGRGRVVGVLAAQAANPWTSEQLLAVDGVDEAVDALAIAPYFGHAFGSNRAEAVREWSVEQLLSACRDAIRANASHIRRHRELAAQHGMELVAYEGGQHLVGVGPHVDDARLRDLFIAANRDPRMADLYALDLRQWVELGGGLHCAFSLCGRPSKWGSWGLVEYQGQPLDEAPKLRAVRALLGAPLGAGR